jgi:hypothetical protein
MAIRKAIGQILEYAYFTLPSTNVNPELVIVAPGPAKRDVTEYLKLLRMRFGIPVNYCTFALGGNFQVHS